MYSMQLRGVNETTQRPAFQCSATVPSLSSLLVIKTMNLSVIFPVRLEYVLSLVGIFDGQIMDTLLCVSQ